MPHGHVCNGKMNIFDKLLLTSQLDVIFPKLNFLVLLFVQILAQITQKNQLYGDELKFGLVGFLFFISLFNIFQFFFQFIKHVESVQLLFLGSIKCFRKK